MINRVLIRLKVIQVVYAYYKNSGKSIKAAEDEVFFSLSKSYDLYKFLLLLIVAVTRYAADRISFNMRKVRPTASDINPNLKFVNNRLAAQIEANEELIKFSEKSKLDWVNYSDFLRRLLDTIVESDIYKEYMESQTSSYEEDRELWRKLYKNFIFNNEDLDTLLEELSLYWNDDKAIVDTFVLKTIKRFDEEEGEMQKLLPEYKDDEDVEYAHKLIKATIQNADEYRKMMSESSKNWDMSRLAFMDVIIMQTALAEVTTFPQIPLSVTLNEYVEIAKYYSTPKSSSFINGLLDTITKKLKSENIINK
ncbi:MAG: transcription antitermination factor NusB [Bacteroidaceae bacterium]|jgi:N utilization substance protein B|nr:transcription antitermination factor NusB [Bacteroidaceae bacterium]MBQ5817364.1 transcription antitermination factor NusB [Bacteroidaceae bacterium]MBR5510788.1 transcription antitermination factor NusB [Bacteroidaceae bacterium]